MQKKDIDNSIGWGGWYRSVNKTYLNTITIPSSSKRYFELMVEWMNVSGEDFRVMVKPFFIEGIKDKFKMEVKFKVKK